MPIKCVNCRHALVVEDGRVRHAHVDSEENCRSWIKDAFKRVGLCGCRLPEALKPREKRKGVKACLDCNEDISFRHENAVRCKACALEHTRVRENAFRRKKRG